MQPSLHAGRSFCPALRIAFFLACGIVAGDLAGIPTVSLEVLVAILTTLLVLSLRFLPASAKSLLSILAFFLLLFVGALRLSLDRASDDSLPARLDEEVVTVDGVVQETPSKLGGRMRFLFRGIECRTSDGTLPLSATFAATVVPVAADTIVLHLDYGMRVKMTGTISLPCSERNPGEFSQRRYFDANGISGSLFVRGMAHLTVSSGREGLWLMRAVVVPLRSGLLAQIDATVGGEEGEFLKGLLIGERSGISAETKQAFIDSGVAHVLAVSGSNVAVVAMMLMFLYDLLRLPRVLRPVVVAAGLLLYMAITGSQPSVVRATVMAMMYLLAGVLQVRSNGYNALGLSAIIILLWDARQLFDIGFQLSFGAVLSIIHLYPRANAWITPWETDAWWNRAIIWLLRMCAVSFVATLGTIPVTALSFGRVSVISVLANIPVIPATGVSVILGAAGAGTGLVSAWLSGIYGTVNAVVLRWTLQTACWAASFPWASVSALRFTLLDAFPFYAAVGLLFHWRERETRSALVIAFLLGVNLVVFVRPADPANPARLRLSVIDVGQGDALLLEFPSGETALIDGGPWTPDFDTGEKTVVPFLKRRGIAKIDLLVVTHPHNDHIGGVPSVMRHFAVGRVVSAGQPIRAREYDAFLRAVAANGCSHVVAKQGMILEGGQGSRWYVMAPGAGFVDADTSHATPNLNNTSVVIKLQYGNVSFLLTGDAEEDVEEDLLARYGDFLRSSLLKAGHHGSITSSSAPFVAAVRPAWVAISVGLHNKFHHPSGVVIRRYDEEGASVARTDREGALMFETDGTTLTQVHWR